MEVAVSSSNLKCKAARSVIWRRQLQGSPGEVTVAWHSSQTSLWRSLPFRLSLKTYTALLSSSSTIGKMLLRIRQQQAETLLSKTQLKRAVRWLTPMLSTWVEATNITRKCSILAPIMQEDPKQLPTSTQLMKLSALISATRPQKRCNSVSRTTTSIIYKKQVYSPTSPKSSKRWTATTTITSLTLLSVTMQT